MSLGALDVQNLFRHEGKKKKKSLLQIFSANPEKPKSGVALKNFEFWLRKLGRRSKLALEKLLKGKKGLRGHFSVKLVLHRNLHA